MAFLSPPFGRHMGKVGALSISRWKARDQLPISQSLKKIAILWGAIFAQISPFRAKSQFFANFALKMICNDFFGC